MRSKKLRGSGGYIMATVTDEQQTKGNLGGPDLFLAPIGRLESEKISKFFCNTCEKDYEGAPQITFENPNEEVAENLILVEKGQYVCTTCGSTLAEYREFKKPYQAGEIGNAKPMTSSSELVPPSFSEPEPTVTLPDFDVQSTPTSTVQQDILSETQPGTSFNTIAGMSVYDGNAKKIGAVKQVGVDSAQTVVLIITKNDGSEITVKWDQIKKVGEIILLNEGIGGTTSVIQQVKCSNCSFDNKPGSKFCQSCGTKI